MEKSKLSTWYRKIRVQGNGCLGYEVVAWRIWFPIWVQYPKFNVFSTKEEAIDWITEFETEKSQYL